tara:strand:- start:1424 stop:2284 length:861 start_codon:yes stop_codon:yes gene_type:complete
MFRDMTISELCETEDHICEDNIYDLYSEGDTSQYKYTIPFILFYAILFYAILFGFVKDFKRLALIDLISFFSLFMMIFIHINYSHTEMCKFPRWCHEGESDTITENSYFYRMDKCPKFGSWLVYYYEDIINYDYNHLSRNHCEESLYGCCKIDNTSCDSVVREGDSYSFYQILLERNTRWYTSIEKIDESGSNCPTIEEIIYKVSSNVIKINLKYEIYILLFIIIFVNIYIPYKLYFKSDKMIISQDDIEMSDSTDSDDSGENGWRITQSGQGEIKRERIKMSASV